MNAPEKIRAANTGNGCFWMVRSGVKPESPFPFTEYTRSDLVAEIIAERDMLKERIEAKVAGYNQIFKALRESDLENQELKKRYLFLYAAADQNDFDRMYHPEPEGYNQ